MLNNKPNELLKSEPLWGLNILVAEDSADIQMFMECYLKVLGASFAIVENGQKALQKIETQEFDLVLMDIQMPVMDGYETVTALRSRDFKKPVFALTAHVVKEEQDRIVASGFDDCFCKPVNWPQLIQRLREIPELRAKLDAQK